VKVIAPKVLEFAKAVGHPLRLGILLRFGEVERTSPVSLSKEFESSLNVVGYHVIELVRAGVLVEVDRRPRRGVVEHFYSIADHGCSLLEAAGFISCPWPDPRSNQDEDARGGETGGDGRPPGHPPTAPQPIRRRRQASSP
jgi:hypothetical protein